MIQTTCIYINTHSFSYAFFFFFKQARCYGCLCHGGTLVYIARHFTHSPKNHYSQKLVQYLVSILTVDKI